jgi:hypothetical protein
MNSKDIVDHFMLCQCVSCLKKKIENDFFERHEFLLHTYPSSALKCCCMKPARKSMKGAYGMEILTDDPRKELQSFSLVRLLRTRISSDIPLKTRWKLT